MSNTHQHEPPELSFLGGPLATLRPQSSILGFTQAPEVSRKGGHTELCPLGRKLQLGIFRCLA